MLGLVLGFKKDRYQVLSERGRTLDFTSNRLRVFDLKAQPLAASEQVTFLGALKSQSRALGQSIQLEELWKVVSEYNRDYELGELAELYFSKPSSQQTLALALMLLSDRSYFKRDKEAFVARPAHVVEELKKAAAQQQQRQDLRRSFVEFIKTFDSEKSNIPQPLDSLVHLLKRQAVGADMTVTEAREAKELTELALESLHLERHRNINADAYQVLEKLKIFDARTNPAWERSGLSGALSNEIAAGAGEQAPSTERKDLSELDVFTIDDVSTRDMDDALSLELTSEGYRLGIHITDVSSSIEIGSALDREISRRLSSIYLPDRTVHMLPEALSLEALSLREGERRKALSVMVDLNKSYELLRTEIFPSWVRVKRRWTYDHVDELLEASNSEFNTFYEIAAALEEKRMEAGAHRVQKTEIAIDVDEQGKVSLREVDEQAPARNLIAEMAVLINRIVAEYCRDQKIPVIYRGQPQSEQDDEPKPEQGRALDHFIRVRLKRSEPSLDPLPHAGLGLKAYLQITSPIRRYVDLINQRQLMAHLAGARLPYSRSDLEELIPVLEEGLVKIQKVSKESKRFWFLRYLEQRIAKNPSSGRKIGGIVVRTTGKYPLVELDEVFFASLVKSSKKLNVGERVEVLIGGIDARDDYLRLEM